MESMTLLPVIEGKSSLLVDVVENIMKYHFTNDRLLVIIGLMEDSQVLTNILRNIRSNFLLPILLLKDHKLPSNNIQSFHYKSQQYILLVEEVNCFVDLFNNLSNLSIWNSKAKFLVITKFIKVQTMKSIFEEAAFRFVTNIIVVKEDKHDSNPKEKSVFSVYTYFPFSEGNCVYSGDVVLLDQWKYGHFVQGNQLYPHKQINLYQCPLTICTFDFPPMLILKNNTDTNFTLDGAEGRILSVAAAAMNFTPRITKPSDGRRWGIVYQNGSADGLVGDLIRRQADIGIAFLSLSKDRYELLEMTNMYLVGCFTWVVPKAQFYPHWMHLILPFSLQMWICVITSTLVTILGLILVNSAQTHSNEISNICLDVFSITCLLSVPKPPTFSRSRIIFILYVWVCLIVMTGYTSCLVSHLTIPKRMKDIDSLEDILDSQLTVGGHPNFHKIFNSSDVTVKKIMSKFVSGRDNIKLLKRIAEQRDFAMPFNKDNLLYICRKLKYLGSETELLVHILPGCTLTYSVHTMFTKDSPFAEKYNDVTVRLMESGFIEKWVGDFKKGEQNYFTRTTENETDYSEKSLNAEKMTGSFIPLIIGLSLSTLVHIFRYVIWYFKCRPRLIVNNKNDDSRKVYK